MSFPVICKKPLFEAFGKPKKVADVGIELEVEGQNLPSAVPHWQAKAEGSLQNGIEYITKPIKADVVPQYVTNLYKFIKEVGGTVQPSYRCSTHIHLNMLPETVEDVLGYVVVFTMFEPLLLSLCGPQRNGNLFCMSGLDTGDLSYSLDRLCYTFDKIMERGFAYERGKYSALNTGRLADLGTLEARCFPLSQSGDEVAKWCGWLMTIRDIVRAEPDKTFRTLWKSVRQNPYFYATKIFGTEQGLPNVQEHIDAGTEYAYELTKVLKRWHSKEATETKARRPRKYVEDAIQSIGDDF